MFGFSRISILYIHFIEIWQKCNKSTWIWSYGAATHWTIEIKWPIIYRLGCICDSGISGIGRREEGRLNFHIISLDFFPKLNIHVILVHCIYSLLFLLRKLISGYLTLRSLLSPFFPVSLEWLKNREKLQMSGQFLHHLSKLYY